MQIIGVLGKSGSGKDTVADILVNKYNFAKISFADPMKKFCHEVFDFTEEQLWGPSEKRNEEDERWPRPKNADEKYLTPRFALQQLGTNWGRECSPEVWVSYAIKQAKKLLSSDEYRYSQQKGVYSIYSNDYKDNSKHPSGVVISDCRFVNEINCIKIIGGRVLKVKRDVSFLKGDYNQHQSETEQNTIPDNMFDYIISNNGTIRDLENTLNKII